MRAADTKRGFVQNGRGGVGAQRQQPLQPMSPTEPCVLVVTNRTREAISLQAHARTPVGPSFVDELRVDLSVGGFAVLACCLGSDLHLGCDGAGLHKLVAQNGELRLSPGGGLRQRAAPASLHLPAKLLLFVDVEEVVEAKENVYPPLPGVLGGLDGPLACALAARSEPLPSPCTLLLPRALPRSLVGLPEASLFKLLALPVALFFEARREGVERNVNGDEVRVAPAEGEKIVFEIAASVEAPRLRLQALARPLRCLDRFQLVYLCD